ncbi:MAG: GGDEF domain-containing protein [Lachnospiraceae bacterium]|nr:GGDEF domain-containing protein [Lachnospiraceae bacterium]
MDFQAVADGIAAMTCVVSVEDLGEGKYGKICIETGNKAYIDSIENPAPGTAMLTDKFVPGAEYTTYLSRDLNFEDYCYKAAVQGKCLHSYARPDRIPVWFNMTFLPLSQRDGNICYCTYTMEINYEASAERMSNISGELASAVLETGLKLRGTTDYRKAMQDVIIDIREICGAEHCCILLMDQNKHTCSVLCEAFSEDTLLKPMGEYLDDGFYDIAASWEETVIAGSNCLIAKNEQDMEVVRERNRIWHDSITSAGGRNIVLFPLRSQGQLLGYIWAINFNADDSVRIKEALELTTFILGSEIGGYLLIDRLKELSSRDMLTGVMNRNEMNNLVDRLDRGEEGNDIPITVIFTDLNGLKTVNDRYGHGAGDTLLKNAASALLEIFDEKSVFRAGGDEFAIIEQGTTEEEMNKKIDALRKASQKYDKVVFAIGGHMEKQGSDIRTALRLADEKMYIDKRHYYEMHPEERRVASKDGFNC